MALHLYAQRKHTIEEICRTALVVAPPVYMLAGEGLCWLSRSLQRALCAGFRMLSYRLPKWAMRNYLLTGSLVVVLCGSIGVVEFRRYFIYWARDPKVDEAFARSYADTAESLNQLPNDQIKRVVIELDNEQVNSDFWSAWTIMFLTDTAKPEKQAGRNIYYVRPDDNIEVDCTYKVFIQPSY